MVYPAHESNEIFEHCIDLLMITDENKSYYVYIKHFNRFMWNKKKTFEGIVYNVSVVKEFGRT